MKKRWTHLRLIFNDGELLCLPKAVIVEYSLTPLDDGVLYLLKYNTEYRGDIKKSLYKVKFSCNHLLRSSLN